MTTDDYIHRLRPGKPGAPLLVALHGTGGDENQFFDFAASIAPEATTVSPRGDVSERGAARFFRRTGEGVYDMDDLVRATAKLKAFLLRLQAEYRTGPVHGFGYSNGANILANLLFDADTPVARAALLHPLIPFQPPANPALAGRSILVTAGERDPICPAALTRGLIGHFEAQGAVVTSVWHAGGHEIRAEEGEALKAFLG